MALDGFRIELDPLFADQAAAPEDFVSFRLQTHPVAGGDGVPILNRFRFSRGSFSRSKSRPFRKWSGVGFSSSVNTDSAMYFFPFEMMNW